VYLSDPVLCGFFHAQNRIDLDVYSTDSFQAFLYYLSFKLKLPRIANMLIGAAATLKKVWAGRICPIWRCSNHLLQPGPLKVLLLFDYFYIDCLTGNGKRDKGRLALNSGNAFSTMTYPIN